MTILGLLLGPMGAAKAYAVLTTFFVGSAAMLFSRTVVRHPLGQLCAGVFVVAGPFQVALYGQGDYLEFVAEALVFLSLCAMWLAVHRPSQRWCWLPTSVWLMLFTFAQPQAFLLGILLMVCLVPVYVRDARVARGLVTRWWGGAPPGDAGAHRTRPSWRAWLSRTVRGGANRSGFLKEIGALLARLPAVIVAAAVILIPAYLTFYILGSGATASSSTLALPLSTFHAYSRVPLSLLTLSSYFGLSGTMVGSGLGGAMAAAAWMAVVVLLVALVWVSYLFVRDVRLLYLLVVAVAAAMVGAGPLGPLAGATVYLYLHVPGYAALNGSYYWDWFVITPVYALMLGLLVEGTLRPGPGRPAAFTGSSRRAGTRTLRRLLGTPHEVPSTRAWARATRVVAVGVVVLLGVSVLVPIVNGGYYGPPDGIHEANYPAGFDQVPTLLRNLIGNSYAGVALFNPDVNWFLTNSSQLVPNAFFLYPTVRTSGLPVYLAPTLQSNSYYYWLYDQFYSNSTHYAGELFALVGVEYFVVFYGIQSALAYPQFLPTSYDKNASALMEYQQGIVPVVSEKSFSIFRDLAYNGVALADRDLSIVAGPGYEELNALAYAGIPLENQSWLFASDLPSNDCATDLGRVDRVYATSLNALIGVALECDHVSVADPVEETAPYANPSQAWTPSTSTLNVSILESSTQPLATTIGGPHTLSVPLSAGGCPGTCRIWLPVRFDGDGGNLSFGWGSSTWTLHTQLGFSGLNNTMVWVELPFGVAGSGTLSITGTGGWNAVGSIYVFDSGSATSPFSPTDWLNRTLSNASVVQVTPASVFDLPTFATTGPHFEYVHSPPNATSNSFPGGQGIEVSNVGSAPVSVTLPMVQGDWPVSSRCSSGRPAKDTST